MKFPVSKVSLFIGMVLIAGPVAIMSVQNTLVATIMIVVSAAAILGSRAGAHRQGTVSSRLWVPSPIAGLIPIVAAFAVLRTGLAVAGIQDVSMDLSKSSLIASATFFLATLLLGRSVFPPSKMKESWARVAGPAGEYAFAGRYRRSLANSIVWGYGLLVVILVTPGQYVLFSVLAVCLGVALLMDLGDELDFRRDKGFYVAVARTNRLHQVPIVVAVLESKSVDVFVRGRRMKQMLGPAGINSSPIEIMVSGEAFEESLAHLAAAGLGAHDGLVDVEEQDHDKRDGQDQSE